ncbi:ABC transporter substrate-binding protein [Zestomonas thermotolerans]|uniref:ABC transporter substrate-binding protein n=1 Tax=Zestomonas thermotolerans TaxID=157784 RepID=UPI0004825A01|nr:ABC transporter substrate-binding protein [Pseudomonas thermotolerans]
MKPVASFLASASMLSALFAASPLLAAEKLSIVTFGGAYESAVKEAYLKPYTQATGVTFGLEAYDGGLAKLSAMVQANNTTWDVVDLESNDAIAACDEGLLMKFDQSLLGDASDFIEGSISECAVASMAWSTIFAYDSSKLASAPSSVADFFDTEKFPGKRGLRKSPKATLEWALLADGVSKDEVYDVLGTPEGVERAFNKLNAIKKDIIWWESGAQAPQLLADGAVVMVQAYNGRIQTAVDSEQKPFKIVWDGQVYDFEWWGVPKGSKNAKRAAEFIAFASKPEVISQLSRYIAYAPPRTKAFEHIAPEILNTLPTAPNNFRNAVHNDAIFWADNFDVINKRFQAWLSQP